MAKTYTNRYGALYQKVTLNLSARAMGHVRDAAKKGFRSISAEVDMILQEHMSGGAKATTYPNGVGSEVELAELIARVPWQATDHSGDTWPSEYVPTPWDDQRELAEAVFSRLRAGEGVATRFFQTTTTCLFIGEYKYWLMADSKPVDVDSMARSSLLDSDSMFLGCSVHRARLYRDRRDFMVQAGDSPGNYHIHPPEDRILEER